MNIVVFIFFIIIFFMCNSDGEIFSSFVCGLSIFIEKYLKCIYLFFNGYEIFGFEDKRFCVMKIKKKEG